MVDKIQILSPAAVILMLQSGAMMRLCNTQSGCKCLDVWVVSIIRCLCVQIFLQRAERSMHARLPLVFLHKKASVQHKFFTLTRDQQVSTG